MVRIRAAFGISATLIAGSSIGAQTPALPKPLRELRAAWVATVANIDWPSEQGLPAAEQQRELTAILDKAVALNLNCLVFQVRPTADALYRSKLEPWSEWLTGEQGKPPSEDWDPLEFAIRGAHRRGIELHAWLNPFRARHAKSKAKMAALHVSRQQPNVVVRYGSQLWMDPGRPAAREHVLKVVRDIVRRYDVDGIHLDDYFYPYPEQGREFPDETSYRAYRQDGGRLARDDWRRHNVDSLVERLYAEIKRDKRWVKFGISPFGIARPGVPRGIQAGLDQYAELYADVRKWLAQGWCDYLSPQLYWPIDQRPQSYAVLLRYWGSVNPRGRHLWPGNFTSKVLENWRPSEIVRQVEMTRNWPDSTGNIHFSVKALDPEQGVGAELRRGLYRDQALVPASPWLAGSKPSAPTLDDPQTRSDGVVQRWRKSDDAWLWTVYLRHGDRWLFDQVLPRHTTGLLLTTDEVEHKGVSAIAIGKVDRFGIESPPAMRRL